MTQSERWLANWQEIMDFMQAHKRRPSKYVPEEKLMHHWWKHQQKLMNADELRPERVDLFRKLLEVGERYKRVNQWD